MALGLDRRSSWLEEPSMLVRRVLVVGSTLVVLGALTGCSGTALDSEDSAGSTGRLNQSRDLSVQTDLANARTALVAYASVNDGLPDELDEGELRTFGFSRSAETKSLSYELGKGTNAGLFCLTATTAMGKTFVVTTNTATAPGATCPESF